MYFAPQIKLIQEPSPLKKKIESKKSDELTLKGGKTVIAEKIEFEGNRAVTTAELNKVVSGYTERFLSQSDLDQIKQQIKKYYQQKGYPDAEVHIPMQQKKNSLLIEINEGKRRGTNRWRKQ